MRKLIFAKSLDTAEVAVSKQCGDSLSEKTPTNDVGDMGWNPIPGSNWLGYPVFDRCPLCHEDLEGSYCECYESKQTTNQKPKM